MSTFITHSDRIVQHSTKMRTTSFLSWTKSAKTNARIYRYADAHPDHRSAKVDLSLLP